MYLSSVHQEILVIYIMDMIIVELILGYHLYILTPYMELQYLSSNLDTIISVLMQNTRVKKYYDYQRELKRIP